MLTRTRVRCRKPVPARDGPHIESVVRWDNDPKSCCAGDSL